MLPMQGVQSLIPCWGTRSHMLQLRVLMLQLKDFKCCNQDPVQPNKYFKKEQKNDRSDLLNSVAWALLSHLMFQCRPLLLGGCVVHQLELWGYGVARPSWSTGPRSPSWSLIPGPGTFFLLRCVSLCRSGTTFQKCFSPP